MKFGPLIDKTYLSPSGKPANAKLAFFVGFIRRIFAFNISSENLNQSHRSTGTIVLSAFLISTLPLNRRGLGKSGDTADSEIKRQLKEM